MTGVGYTVLVMAIAAQTGRSNLVIRNAAVRDVPLPAGIPETQEAAPDRETVVQAPAAERVLPGRNGRFPAGFMAALIV